MNTRISFKNQITALLLFTSLTFVASSCKKDNLDEASLEVAPAGQISADAQGRNLTADMTAADGIISSSYYLVNSLPAGYVKDGSVDYTAYVQAAVANYSNIVFPGFPILVNDKGINVGSNKTITFEPGSELRLKASSNGTYAILRISNVSNVTLFNPVVIGDRDNHIGTEGEWGMGIGIYGSSNVSIYSPKVSNCWGDGIYIGQVNSIINSKNIVIKDAYLKKNRRDGISIISVDGLLLDNLYAGYTDGTLPKTGINIETNNTACVVKNVRINNPRTENNGANGILINMRTMLGLTTQTADVTITNHFDTGSPRYALKVSTKEVDYAGKLMGFVNVVNPTWHKTSLETGAPIWLGSNHPDFKINISSPEWMTSAGTILSYTNTYNLLMKYASGSKLTVTNEEPTPVTTVEAPTTAAPATIPTLSSVVFAVNAGGSSFTASNGIIYSADKNFSSGSAYKVSTSTSILNTNDDALYQSERYGNFSYSIPVSNGTYEITFKTSENYHNATGKRKFDILAEGQEIVSNLDIFAAAGNAKAYDIVKTVSVTDGNLDLSFRKELDQAKVAAFHVIKK